MRYFSVAILTLMLVGGCGRSGAADSRARRVGPAIVERMPPPGSLGKLPESKRRFREAAVYLDGAPKGVLKHSELAPEVQPKMEKRADTEFPVYTLVDYLVSVGADLQKIRELHLYGGRRVCILDGDEVRKQRSVLKFSFSRGDAGKPRMEWPTTKIRMNTTIDIIQSVVIYQEKVPPHLDRSLGSLTFDDGKPIEGIPYAPVEQIIKGTRIYVDGRLAGAMKRKQIPSTFQIPGSDAKPRFQLAAYVASLGAPLDHAKTIDFIQGEDTVARYDAKSWKSVADRLEFSLPRRNQGQIVVHLERPDGPAVDSKVSAILLYDRAKPPTRTIAPPVPDDDGEGGERGADPARSMLDE